MKIKKQYRFKNNKQIWRLLITSSDKLVIETRENNSKEVSFSCVDAFTGKKIFTDFQFDEKHYIGIETTSKDTLLVHKFVKPDLPMHKEIIAFDLNSQKILWHNSDFTFYCIYNEEVYCFKQKFEDRDFYAINLRDGKIIRELGKEAGEISKVYQIAGEEYGNLPYIFPDLLPINSVGPNNLKTLINIDEIFGEIGYCEYNSFLLANYHTRKSSGKFSNTFLIVDKVKNKIIFKETLNTDLDLLEPDSFFVYKNLLFLLKGKFEVVVYKLE